MPGKSIKTKKIPIKSILKNIEPENIEPKKKWYQKFTRQGTYHPQEESVVPPQKKQVTFDESPPRLESVVERGKLTQEEYEEALLWREQYDKKKSRRPEDLVKSKEEFRKSVYEAHVARYDNNEPTEEQQAAIEVKKKCEDATKEANEKTSYHLGDKTRVAKANKDWKTRISSPLPPSPERE